MPSHVRITLGGRMVAGQRWSVGHTVVLGSASPLTPQLNALAEACFARFKARVWVGSSAGFLAGINSQETTLDNARAYFYPADSTTASNIGVSTGAAVSGSRTSGTTAAQLCLVATLEDGLAGRRHKGRMYLPANALTTAAASLQVDGSFCQATATNVANYFEDLINTTPVAGLTITPVVSSLTNGDILTAVSVDTVLDTQRRRRDKISGTRYRDQITIG